MTRAALALMLLAGPAMAHNAPSGWAYDPDCCGGWDCAQARPVTGFVPLGDPRIRVSGDEDRHVCLSATGHVLCIYIAPGGV